jgi:hypothetical protein
VCGDCAIVNEVPGAQVKTCVARVIVKLTLDEVADEYVESAAILAVTVHVPGATKTTAPVEEFMVHTARVELK